MEGEVRVFQGSFLREIIEPHYHELERHHSMQAYLTQKSTRIAQIPFQTMENENMTNGGRRTREQESSILEKSLETTVT